ncbi:NAD(P)-binding protein [Streptosporangium sp. NPDC051022]|uniref:oxidoreductase n=1 Tax=Streptosporangium sp. NPDC051022 TaxID=3155752 RepID=UPI003412E403
MHSPTLASPILIGRHEVRNRVMCLPHDGAFVSRGLPDPEYAAYVARICENDGVGLFVLGGTAVHHNTWHNDRHLRLFDPDIVPPLRRMVLAAQAEGTRFVVQLGHLGREMRSREPLTPIWGPSEEASPTNGEVPRAMTGDDIAEARAAFVEAARIALLAGADGVEVHAAQGYLLHEFLSPWSNQRTDGYGGALGNRMRLVREILSEIRATLDPPILGMKISCLEEVEGGLTFDDVRNVVTRLGEEGLLDYVTLTVEQGFHNHMRDGGYPQGGLRGHTRELKAITGTPVVVSQRIVDGDVAADLIASGDADMVGVARALIADPAWASKAVRGEHRAIRPCVACAQDCRVSTSVSPIGCAVNPSFAVFEQGSRLRAVSGRVLVVGGGPAGCTAALRAADAGARVDLYDARPRLGGRIRLAGHAPNRTQFADYADYLEREVEGEAAIVPHLGRTVRPEDFGEAAYDLVVVAVGGAPYVPERVAAAHPGAVTVDALLTGDHVPAGGPYIVIDPNGEWPAANATEFLTECGLETYHVTDRSVLFERIPRESRDFLVRRLEEGPASPFVSARVTRDDAGFVLTSRLSGQRVRVAAEATVVWGGAARSNPADLDGWRRVGADVIAVGDAVSVRGLSRAVHEGYLAGSRIRSTSAPV